MPFTLKSVNPSAHVGTDLLELRRRRNLTRADAAQQTKITESSLRALEEESWENFSDPLSTERLLRAYVEFLGGNVPYALKKYRACLKQSNLHPRPQDALPLVRRLRLLDLAVLSRVIAFIGFLVFVGFLGAYVYVQARVIQAPPPLLVSAPVDGARLSEPAVRVNGKTAPEANVTVNGQAAMVQADGSFSLSLTVPRGATLVTVSAKKRHGHETLVTRRVIYDPTQP